MIWVRGEIVADDALTIGVRDRTFEHGLGLFETLRTWAGRPTLLDRHLARLRASAEALGIPIDPAALPDARAVVALVEAEGILGDAVLRITTSGGTAEPGSAVAWMRSRPLPPPIDRAVDLAPPPWSVADDPTQRHKTLNYWAKRLAHESCWRVGVPHEVLVGDEGGLIWEGTRSNLFLIEGENLVTPHLDGPVLPGVMRAFVIETAADLGWTVRECELTLSRVTAADEIFLTNAVQGVMPATRAEGGTIGPKTGLIREEVLRRLERGAIRP